MNNLLNDKQREQLAELAGAAILSDGQRYIFPGGNWACSMKDFLTGDLTSEASYYQAHLVLSSLGNEHDVYISYSGTSWAVSIHTGDKGNCLGSAIEDNYVHAICLAALELLENEHGILD